MSGDNSKDKKEEMDHPEDENSQSAITKQAEKKAVKNELKSEEPAIVEKQPSKRIESIEAAIMGSFPDLFYRLLIPKLMKSISIKFLK